MRSKLHIGTNERFALWAVLKSPLRRKIALWSVIMWTLWPLAAHAGWDCSYCGVSLHAVVGGKATCNENADVSCCGWPDPFPASRVPPATEITVFVVVTNVLCSDDMNLRGVQTAFEWDSGWTLLGSEWDCQPNQLTATTPQSPGGPRQGTIATAFDCVNDDHSLVIGKLHFMTGATGCLRQVESEYPFGTHLLDCDGEALHLRLPQDHRRVGTICIDYAYEGCWDPWAVEDVTWGRIKARYVDEAPRR